MNHAIALNAELPTTTCWRSYRASQYGLERKRSSRSAARTETSELEKNGGWSRSNPAPPPLNDATRAPIRRGFLRAGGWAWRRWHRIPDPTAGKSPPSVVSPTSHCAVCRRKDVSAARQQSVPAREMVARAFSTRPRRLVDIFP